MRRGSAARPPARQVAANNNQHQPHTPTTTAATAATAASTTNPPTHLCGPPRMGTHLDPHHLACDDSGLLGQVHPLHGTVLVVPWRQQARADNEAGGWRRTTPTTLMIITSVFFAFSSHQFSDSPSDQGETWTTLCNVSRRLHLFSLLFCPTRTNRGYIGGGEHRGFFLLCAFKFFAPPSSCGACLHFISREGFGRPCPSSTTKSNYCLLTKGFSYKSLSTTSPLFPFSRQTLRPGLREEPVKRPSTNLTHSSAYLAVIKEKKIELARERVFIPGGKLTITKSILILWSVGGVHAYIRLFAGAQRPVSTHNQQARRLAKKLW